MLSVHVDYFQGSRNSWFFINVMDRIATEFKISKREKRKFKYTGIDVELNPDRSIVLSQEAYRDSLEEIEVDSEEDGNRNLTKNEYKRFRGATGKISWLADITRPNLAFECIDLSTHNKSATISDAHIWSTP